MISELDIAYAAGLIDGEGSIGLALERKGSATRRPSHRPWLMVGMTDERPVRWLHETFHELVGAGSVQYSPAKPPRREKWIWRVNGSAVRDICDFIHPYLKVKGMQAYLVTCFYEEGFHESGHGRRVPWSEVERREAIRQEFHKANARGC